MKEPRLSSAKATDKDAPTFPKVFFAVEIAVLPVVPRELKPAEVLTNITSSILRELTIVERFPMEIPSIETTNLVPINN